MYIKSVKKYNNVIKNFKKNKNMVLIAIMIKTITETIYTYMYFKLMKHTKTKSWSVRFVSKIHIGSMLGTIVPIRCHIHNITPFLVIKAWLVTLS